MARTMATMKKDSGHHFDNFLLLGDRLRGLVRHVALPVVVVVVVHLMGHFLGFLFLRAARVRTGPR